MFRKYSQQEIEILRKGGKKLSAIMAQLEKFIQVGTRVADIDLKTLELIKGVGGKPATVNYQPEGASYPFPSAVCVSINSEVAHGISTDNPRIIQSGDIVSVDIVMEYQGLFVDICRTYGVGEVSEKNKKLINCAREVTDRAIEKAIIGNRVNEIGGIAEKTARKCGFTTVRELGGHGVGRKIHDKPFIPNFNASDFKDEIKEGMVLAIEPIVVEFQSGIELAEDDYLYTTIDGGNSAQFEETVLITKDGPEILTRDL